MKRNTLIATFAVASFIILSAGCQKPKSNGTDFMWFGTAPLSVEIDGQQYQATQGVVASPSGAIVLYGTNGSDTAVTITFTGVPAENAIYNCPGTADLGMSIQSNGDYYSAVSGAVKVSSLQGNTIEGEFYGTVKDSAGVTHTFKNGYFKMTK